MAEHHAGNEHLADLVEWFAQASHWFEGEIAESRTMRPVDTSFPPEQRIEKVAFVSAELDAMVVGFRRASTMLRAMTADPDLPSVRTDEPARRPTHLRVVK
jgi:hypothetical protein